MHHSHIDKFAYQDSIIHRIDPRVKFVSVIIFTIAVISLPKTAVSILACFAIWPFAMIVLAGIPISYVLKQIIIVSPFILMLALTSIYYDTTPATRAFGPFTFTVRVGVLRCISIILKFSITIAALMSLICTTKFNILLNGLGKMGMPKILIIQLGLIYRYIFMLIDKVQQILRARNIRRLRNLGFKKELKVAGSMVGSLFISSLETSSRVNMAMEARGFEGDFKTISHLQISSKDYIFGLIFAAYMALIVFLIKPIFY